MDWAKNTAEKAQPLAACPAAGTTHKLESAQPKNINAHLNKQVVRITYLSQTNGAPN
jgi:hypothetical protein